MQRETEPLVDYGAMTEAELDAREVEETFALQPHAMHGVDRAMIMNWERDERGIPRPSDRDFGEQTFDDHMRGNRIAYDVVSVGDDGEGVHVSTVFLGKDHGYRGHIILYETRTKSVRLDPGDEFQFRHYTAVAAWRGHQRIVAWMRDGKPLSELDL